MVRVDAEESAKFPKGMPKWKFVSYNLHSWWLLNLHRFLEAVQGKELERIFKEEGVIEEDDDDSEMFDNPEDRLKTSNQDDQEGIHIG